MPTVRRVVRKREPVGGPQFDEQQWPAQVALLLLGGFLLGVAVSRLSFDDLRWWANARTWLFLIPFLTLATMFVLRFLQHRVVRRVVQLAVVLSLLVHAALVVVLFDIIVFSSPWEEKTAQRQVTQKERRSARDYHPSQFDPQRRRQMDIRQPMRTESPEPEPTPIEREQEIERPTHVSQPLPVTRPQPTDRPQPTRRQEAAQSTPRHAAAQSLQSRQTSRAQAASATAEMAAEQSTPAPQQSQQSSSPQQTSVARQSSDAAPAERSNKDAPAAPSSQPTASSARLAQRDHQATLAAAAPSSQRRPDPARPTAEASTAQTMNVTPPSPARSVRATPSAVADARRQPSQPIAERSEREVSETESPSRRPERRQSPAERRPELAQTNQPTPPRRTAVTEAPQLAASAAEQTPSRAPQVETRSAEAVSPRETAVTQSTRSAAATTSPVEAPSQSTSSASVARRAAVSQATAQLAAASQTANRHAATPTTAASSAAEVAAVAQSSAAEQRQVVAAAETNVSRASASLASPSESPTTAPSARPSPAPSRSLAQRSAVPTVDPSAAPTSRPRRAAVATSVASSPQPLDNPSLRQSNQASDRSSPEPAQMALSRGRTGTAGRGSAANLNRAAPAPDNPSTLASGAARREMATQREATGPALTPSARAAVSHSRAAAAAPATSLTIDPVAIATSPSTEQTAPSPVTASASQTRSSADADQGPVTAAQGRLEVDVGPTRVAAERSRGLASGGGRPQISAASGDAPERGAGGAVKVAVASPVASELATAPTGDGGGEPSRPAPNPESLATRGAAGQPPSAAGPRTSPTATSAPSGEAADSSGEPALALAALGGASIADEPSESASAQLSGRLRSSRAPMLEAAPSDPAAGGGDAAERRRPSASLNMAQLAAVPATSEPSSAAGGGATEQGDDAPGPAGVGADSREPLAQGPTTVQSKPGSLVDGPSPTGNGGGSRGLAKATNEGDGPALALAALAAGERRRGPAFSSPVIGSATAVPVEESTPSNEGSGAGAEGGPRLAASGRTGPLLRQGASAPANIAAPLGPGGLGQAPAVNPGLARRPSITDTDHLSLNPARFVREAPGGVPNVDASAIVSSEAFARRGGPPGQGGSPGGDGPVAPETEETIELGLAWLAARQLDDGSWSLNDTGAAPRPTGERAMIESDAAATGLALLSFQGAGYHHREHEYKDVVRRGIDFLVEHQQEDGGLYVETDPESSRSARLYTHGIAALALTEAYGMTQDPSLREPAQRALDYVVKTQHPKFGGWRYTPLYGSDTSVTGWMMMALKSGELAGLTAPPEAYEGVQRWLNMAQASPSDRHLYRYEPFAPNTAAQRHGRIPTASMTAVGLLMRLYLGWGRDNHWMEEGADHLLKNLPNANTSRDRDTYYWYYGTQVMFHAGGEHWQKWNAALHPLLVDSQQKTGPQAGSWDPLRPVADRWGHQAGRLYVTTLNLLSLEVYYRHLPLYDETAR